MEDEAGLYEPDRLDGPRAAEAICARFRRGPAPSIHCPLMARVPANPSGATVIVGAHRLARHSWLRHLHRDARRAVRCATRSPRPACQRPTRRVAQVVRVESGRPLFGVDMDEHTIPLEAGIEDRAISFSKGCYVGQEVIVRVLHRGGGRSRAPRGIDARSMQRRAAGSDQPLRQNAAISGGSPPSSIRPRSTG